MAARASCFAQYGRGEKRREIQIALRLTNKDGHYRVTVVMAVKRLFVIYRSTTVSPMAETMR